MLYDGAVQHNSDLPPGEGLRTHPKLLWAVLTNFQKNFDKATSCRHSHICAANVYSPVYAGST